MLTSVAPAGSFCAAVGRIAARCTILSIQFCRKMFSSSALFRMSHAALTVWDAPADDGEVSESSAITRSPDPSRSAVKMRPRKPSAPVTSTKFCRGSAMACENQTSYPVFFFVTTASNSPTSGYRVQHFARGTLNLLCDLAPTLSGDSDQQFTPAVAHRRGAFRTRARIDRGARVCGNLAPYAVCRHGIGRRPRRCALPVQRYAGHGDH